MSRPETPRSNSGARCRSAFDGSDRGPRTTTLRDLCRWPGLHNLRRHIELLEVLRKASCALARRLIGSLSAPMLRGFGQLAGTLGQLCGMLKPNTGSITRSTVSRLPFSAADGDTTGKKEGECSDLEHPPVKPAQSFGSTAPLSGGLNLLSGLSGALALQRISSRSGCLTLVAVVSAL